MIASAVLSRKCFNEVSVFTVHTTAFFPAVCILNNGQRPEKPEQSRLLISLTDRAQEYIVLNPKKPWNYAASGFFNLTQDWYFTGNEITCVHSEKRKRSWNHWNSKTFVVDDQGFEPWTPWLRVRCSASWANHPYAICAGRHFCEPLDDITTGMLSSQEKY